VHISTRTITASKLAQSPPPSVSPNSNYYILQVRTIMASKCISILAHLPPLHSLDHGLKVYLPTHSIKAFKCISKLEQLRPPSLHIYGLQVHLQTRMIMASKLARLRPPSISPNSHGYGLQVHLQTCSITISECISKSTRSRSLSESPNTPDYRLQVQLQTPSAKNISVQAERLRQGGRVPSEPSETPRWHTTPRPAPIRRVALHIALQSLFRCFFSLCRYSIVNEHCGVVANYDHTSEWVHWVHQQNVNRSGNRRQGSISTRDFVYHIRLCYSHKIRYLIIWHALFKYFYIYTYGQSGHRW